MKLKPEDKNAATHLIRYLIICIYKLHFHDIYIHRLLNNIQQEGYIKELSRFLQCLNAKTGYFNFKVCVSIIFILTIYVSDSRLSEYLYGQYLNIVRLTAPLYIISLYIQCIISFIFLLYSFFHRNALGGSAYGVDHIKLSKSLSLSQDIVRSMRDDITIQVSLGN